MSRVDVFLAKNGCVSVCGYATNRSDFEWRNSIDGTSICVRFEMFTKR